MRLWLYVYLPGVLRTDELSKTEAKWLFTKGNKESIMSHDILTDIAVFKTSTTAPTRDNKEDEGLFGTDNELSVVMGKIHSSNVCPAAPRWIIMFVGTSPELMRNFFPMLGGLVKDGYLVAPTFMSGSRLIAHIKDEFYRACAITVDVMHDLGVFAYSWTDAYYREIPSKGDGIEYKALNQVRHGYLLGGNDDVELMIHQSASIRETSGGYLRYCYPALHGAGEVGHTTNVSSYA